MSTKFIIKNEFWEIIARKRIIKEKRMCEAIIKFFIYSAMGWVCENVWHFILYGRFEHRRQLVTLPLCPVYGFGGMLLSALLDSKTGIITLFAGGALLASAAELLWYIAFLKLFDVKLWDYSGYYGNLFGGVCGVYTLLWGILAVIFVRIINPAVSPAVADMSVTLKLFASVFLGVITAADMRKTAAVLLDYKRGIIGDLPECFGYMKKNL